MFQQNCRFFMSRTIPIVLIVIATWSSPCLCVSSTAADDDSSSIFSIPVQAKANPDASTASRVSQKEWEMIRRKNMPQASAGSNNNKIVSDEEKKSGRRGENDEEDEDEDANWFHHEEHSAATRFGKTLDHIEVDPTGPFLSRSNKAEDEFSFPTSSGDTSTAAATVSMVSDRMMRRRRKSDAATASVDDEDDDEFSFSCQDILRIVEAPSSSSDSSSSSQQSRLLLSPEATRCKSGGVATLLPCVVCNGKDHDKPRSKRSMTGTHKNINSTMSSTRREIVRATAMLAAQQCFPFSKSRIDERWNTDKQFEALSSVVADALVPSLQAVSDWLSYSDFGRCSADTGPIRLISVTLSKPTRSLVLQRQREKEEDDDAQHQQRRSKRKPAWQMPTLIRDTVQARSGVNSFVSVGELRTARVLFAFGGGGGGGGKKKNMKTFDIEVERFYLPEMHRAAGFVRSGLYRPSATMTIVPRSIIRFFDKYKEDEKFAAADDSDLSLRCSTASNLFLETNNTTNKRKFCCRFPHQQQHSTSSSSVFTLLSWNLWHTQANWLGHRCPGIAKTIRQLSPNAIALQEMRLDTTAEMFLQRSASWHNDMKRRKRAATCDTGGHTDVFDQATYFRASFSMMEHLHRRVRTKIPYFTDMLPAMLYLRDRYWPQEQHHHRHHDDNKKNNLPGGMLQWQSEGLGMMHRHYVLGRRRVLLPRQVDPPLGNDEHQRALLCHALLVRLKVGRRRATNNNNNNNKQETQSTARQEHQQKRTTCNKDSAGSCDGDGTGKEFFSSSSGSDDDTDMNKNIIEDVDELVRIDVCTSHFSLHHSARLRNAKNVASAVEDFAQQTLHVGSSRDVVSCSSSSSSSSSSRRHVSAGFKAVATILSGDLNAEPDDAAYKFLTGGDANFSDVYTTMKKTTNNEMRSAAATPCPNREWREPDGACAVQQQRSKNQKRNNNAFFPAHCMCVRSDKGHTFDRRFPSGGVKRIDFMLLKNWKRGRTSDNSSSSSARNVFFELEPTGFRHVDGDFEQQPPLSDHVGLLGEFRLQVVD